MTEGEDEWLRRQEWLNLNALDRQRVGRFERAMRRWIRWMWVVAFVAVVVAVALR